MANKEDFPEFCKLRGGYAREEFNDKLKKGEVALNLALERARAEGVSEEIIQRAEDRGMLDGSFNITYEGAGRIYDRTRAKLTEEQKGVLDCFDKVRDAHLITYYLFCLDPDIRERVKNDKNLYNVVLKVGSEKRKGHVLPVREKIGYDRNGDLLSKNIQDIIKSVPREVYTGESEDERILRMLLEKKAERDIFHIFKDDENRAFGKLDELINDESLNENLRDTYRTIKPIYQGYVDFEVKGVNLDFEDPNTGEKGVLPSLHQVIGLYHLLNEKKFGIFDGCGTGKTAIATLAQQLIKEKIENQVVDGERRKYGKTLVVCPNAAKKPWKKGLVGEDDERYLADKQNIMVVDQKDEKNEEFFERMENSDWVVLNYDQLITDVNGSNELFVNKLLDIGFDYVIFDESHHIKNQETETKTTGKPTISAAARALANKAEYLALLTGSPIPDSLDDYAVPYTLLNSDKCSDPKKFKELYEANARMLYAFFNESSIRRTLEDVVDKVDYEEVDEEVELNPVQRQLYNFIVENRFDNWLHQARKALIDPRLVDPKILKMAGLLGKVSYKDSAKYMRLEEMLTGEDGPVAKGEKFVIFSQYQDGVTRKNNSLKERYRKLGLEEEYEKLNLDKSLTEIVEEFLEEKFGKKLKIGVIDGKVTNIEKREEIVEGLKDGLAGVLCTTDTGGESLEYVAANHAIFLDEDYSPKTAEQALSRLIRKGQKKKVRISHLVGKNTLDEQLKEYVDKKRDIIRIACDGYDVTDEEWAFLQDTRGTGFGEMVKKGFGGIPIDVTEAEIYSLNNFEVKKRIKRKGTPGLFDNHFYETTEAQRLRLMIGNDPLNCWKDPEFVKLYMGSLDNLAVQVVHAARICNLIKRAKEGEIEFPRSVLAEGSGPSLLYNAFNNLCSLIYENGFEIPFVVDRDTSLLMLKEGYNPNQLVGCMTGKDSAIRNSSFDMVDNGSISLLRDRYEVKDFLLESNRVLKQDGLLELVVKNMRFMKEFYSGLEQLGFEVLSEKNQGFFVDKKLKRKLKKEKGSHFAESYAAKLAGTHLLLAQKKDKPAEVSTDNFRFERLGGDYEYSPEEIIVPTKKIITSGEFKPKREVKVDKFGNVVSYKKIEE